MNIGFVSLGCSKNLVDSENIMGLLINSNVNIVKDPSIADAIIINTCAFINSAKEEAIDTILEMAQYKENRCKKLIVVGCLSQRYREQLIDELPEVDRFITIDEYPNIADILSKELDIKVINTYGKTSRLISSKPWSAYLKIAEGCSNNCTYCAIPLIRGGNISFPMEDLIKQAKELAASGVKEIVLIGQDTTKYGIDIYNKLALLDLLQEISKIEEFKWIRVLYMYPDEITNELIEGMSKLDKVIPYFDIPLQYGNDKILKLMNRRGTISSIKETINKIRTTFNEPILRTTFIVGFPNESEEDYQDLLQFTKDIKWDQMGAFAYSKEEDTVAYDFDNQVDEQLAQDRVNELMALQKTISLSNNENRIGNIYEVVIEAYDAITKTYRGRATLHAPDGIDGHVSFRSTNTYELGEFVNVKIIKALPYDLVAEIC